MAQKTTKIKKADDLTEFTPEQLVEFQRCATDPIYCISNYFKVEHPALGLVVFELRDYQKDLIKMFQNNQYCIMMMSRQSGKSTTAGAYLLWYAMFNEYKTVLIASDKNDNATEIIHRMQIMYEHAPMWLKPGVVSDGWNAHSLKMDNGSRVLSAATTPKTGRGMSISKLFCDELAWVGYNIKKVNVQEEFWTSISPTLSTGGDCIVSSTPLVDDDLFATLWRGAELEINGFAYQKVTWEHVPGRDEAWKAKEIARIGLQKFLREYDCEFVGADDLLVDGVTLAALKPSEAIKVSNGFKFFKEPDATKKYIIACDPAGGGGGDFSTIEVFTFPELEQVAEFRSNQKSINFLFSAITNIVKFYEQFTDEVYYSFENNGLGEALIALFENSDSVPMKGTLISETGKDRTGFRTTHKSKLRFCLLLKSLLESGKMTIHSAVLTSELKNFASSGKSYEAKSGATDDCVMAVVTLLRIVEEVANYDEDLYKKMYAIDGEDWFVEYDEANPDHAPLPISF